VSALLSKSNDSTDFFSTEAKALKPFIKGKEKQPSFDIAGVIGLSSSGFAGTIAICFPSDVYLAAMSNMLGETFTEITPELQDGAAELLNMIFGHAKVVLNQQGYTIQKAIPTVVRGTGIQTTYLGKTSVMVLPFQTEFGEIHIEICSDELM
jgi:chemotaxis protein CheX